MKKELEKSIYKDLEKYKPEGVCLTRTENGTGVFDHHIQFHDLGVFVESKIIDSLDEIAEIRASQIDWSTKFRKSGGIALILIKVKNINSYLIFRSEKILKLKLNRVGQIIPIKSTQNIEHIYDKIYEAGDYLRLVANK